MRARASAGGVGPALLLPVLDLTATAQESPRFAWPVPSRFEVEETVAKPLH